MPKLSYPDKSFWTIITLAVVCGLAAGILGAVLSRAYLMSDLFPDDVDLSKLNLNNSGLVIRDPKNVIVSQDVKLAETVESLQPVLIGIFKAVPVADATAYYSLDKPLFIGLVITADGWAIAPLAEELKEDFEFAEYVAITGDRRVYTIDRVAATELPGEPLVFHLAGAANLPVRKIVTRPELSLGETLVVMGGRQAVWPTTLTSLTRAADILSSDTASARLELAGMEGNDWQNAFVFDLAGNLAAVIAADGEIIPAFSLSPLLAALTQSATAPRPRLGLNYLDLSRIKMPALNMDIGALAQAAPGQPAVLKDSPAQVAGLMAGDIITWVGNQEINQEHDLADLIMAYRAGDKITLTYLRAGAEKMVELTLGEFK